MIDPSAPAGAPLYGAAWYPEYQDPARIPVDLDLMAAADVSVVRVGESVWSTWEPRDGEIRVDWLTPALDGAHERGIRVVLGTPTYAVPPWLQRAHPEIAAERRTGERVPWGGRQEVDFTAPAFRERAERVIRAILGAHARHPAVIGFQVDNEPGLHLLHNDAVFTRFVDALRAEHGTVDALNEAWGLVYWSHRLADFGELWRPDGNTLPQYDLAWRRFQASLTTEFLAWQAGIVREYASPEQFTTTCLAFSRPAVEDDAIAAGLDVTAANLYYGMQDHLALGVDLPRVAPWTTTGVHGLIQAADRAYGTKGARFLVTETNAQAIGASDENLPPYPGQLRQAALALVARGAAMVEYWHWNTLPYGTETYWGGVLPHSGTPGRVYAEVAGIGAELKRLGPAIAGLTPEHDVTILTSNASRWAMDFFPPLADAPSPEHGGAYSAILTAFHRGVVESGRQARLLPDTAFAADGRPLTELVAEHPVLVVPGLAVSEDALLDRLVAYAEAGGHLVLGIRTGSADREVRIRAERQPARLHRTAGAWYEEYSNLRAPLPLNAEAGAALRLTAGACATGWADGLLLDADEPAEVLARYGAPGFDRFAAVTTRRTGRGRTTVVGTVPDPVLARDLVVWLARRPVAGDWGTGALPVTASSGRSGTARVVVVHNWSAAPVAPVAPRDLVDPLTGATTPAGTGVRLDAWDARVLLELEPENGR